MARASIKTGIARALDWTGAGTLVGALAAPRDVPLVLAYHRIVEDYAAHAGHALPAMLISGGMLERHLDWLGRRFRFVSLPEIGSRLEEGGRFEKPVCAVTFDDGYADVYHHAFPILRRKGVPAAVFAVTDTIGTSRPPVYDRLYLLLKQAAAEGRSAGLEVSRDLATLGLPPPPLQGPGGGPLDPFTAMRRLLEALPQADLRRVVAVLEERFAIDDTALAPLRPLTWDMLSEMHRAGITIGSHTKSHALLTNEALETAIDETALSRRILEARLGTKVENFAYPDGRFDAVTVKVVAASGYRFGYGSCRHRDRRYPLLTIPRQFLWEKSCLDARAFSPEIMACHARWLFDLVSGCARDHGGPARPGAGARDRGLPGAPAQPRGA